MAQLMLVNPARKRRRKRRRNPESRATRSRAAKAGWKNRRRHRNSWPNNHAGHVKAAKKGWRRRRTTSHSRRRRNPIGGRGIVNGILMPSAIMAAGGLALDVVFGMLPLPAMITGNAGINAVAKGASAIGLGMLAEKVASKRTGELIALGGVTIALYDIMRQGLTTMAPNLTLGYTGAGVAMGPPMGYYLPESVPQTSAPSQTVGEYLPAMGSAT